MDDAHEPQLLPARLVALMLDERRRIERALHDGAQQELIAISVQLQILRGLLAEPPAEALASLDELQRQVQSSLDRIRTLAVGIYPAILDARGLPEALRQTARATHPAAGVEGDAVARYPAEIEAAVIYLWRAVLEGLASDEGGLIRLREEDGALRIEVEIARPVDLSAVGDLIAAAGGAVEVGADSAGGVRVTFPLA